MKDYAEVLCILDRSGSMHAIWDEAIGGINTFLETQRDNNPNSKLSIVLFDHEYTPAFTNMPPALVTNFDRTTYTPRGSTALLDAIGRGVTDLGARLAAMPESERPSKVVVVILTDGLENYSREYTVKRVREMVTHQQEKYGWEFIYLGANQDAFQVGDAYGIPVYNTSGYGTQHVNAAFRAAGQTVNSYSSGITPQSVQDSYNAEVENES